MFSKAIYSAVFFGILSAIALVAFQNCGGQTESTLAVPGSGTTPSGRATFSGSIDDTFSLTSNLHGFTASGTVRANGTQYNNTEVTSYVEIRRDGIIVGGCAGPEQPTSGGHRWSYSCDTGAIIPDGNYTLTIFGKLPGSSELSWANSRLLPVGGNTPPPPEPTGLQVQGAPPVTLVWTAPPGVSGAVYDLDILPSDVNNNSPVVTRPLLSATQYAISGLNLSAGTYRWGVRTNVSSRVSTTAFGPAFTIASTGQTQAPAPTNRTNYPSATNPTKVKWNVIALAGTETNIQYQVNLSCAPPCAYTDSVTASLGTNPSELNLPSGLPIGSYSWTIQSIPQGPSARQVSDAASGPAFSVTISSTKAPAVELATVQYSSTLRKLTWAQINDPSGHATDATYEVVATLSGGATTTFSPGNVEEISAAGLAAGNYTATIVTKPFASYTQSSDPVTFSFSVAPGGTGAGCDVPNVYGIKPLEQVTMGSFTLSYSVTTACKPVASDCVKINEPSDEKATQWNDNWLCSTGASTSTLSYGYDLSNYSTGKNCSFLSEPSDSRATMWNDNTICSVANLSFEWASSRQQYLYAVASGKKCLHIHEPSDEAPVQWADNYLCFKDPSGTAAGDIGSMSVSTVTGPAWQVNWSGGNSQSRFKLEVFFVDDGDAFDQPSAYSGVSGRRSGEILLPDSIDNDNQITDTALYGIIGGINWYTSPANPPAGRYKWRVKRLPYGLRTPAGDFGQDSRWTSENLGWKFFSWQSGQATSLNYQCLVNADCMSPKHCISNQCQ